MFESIVGRQQRERRLGSGAILSFVLHAGALALMIWLPTQRRVESEARGVAVTFFTSPQVKSPGPVPGPAAELPAPATPREPAVRPKAEVRTPIKKPKTVEEKVVEPRVEAKVESKTTDPAVMAKTPTSAQEPASSSGSTDGTTDRKSPGSTGGEKGGTGKGAQIGSATGTGSGDTTHRFEVIPFGPGMDRPKRLAGRAPLYSREALIAKVEGTVIAQCVITLAGTLTGCRIIKGVPHMDAAVLSALASYRYSPVMFQGRAVSVRYVITLKLVLPEHT